MGSRADKDVKMSYGACFAVHDSSNRLSMEAIWLNYPRVSQQMCRPCTTFRIFNTAQCQRIALTNTSHCPASSSPAASLDKKSPQTGHEMHLDLNRHVRLKICNCAITYTQAYEHTHTHTYANTHTIPDRHFPPGQSTYPRP